MPAWFGISLLALFPSLASAHAFGQHYNLPLPTAYYIFGGVGAFIASSVLLLFFSGPTHMGRSKKTVSVRLPLASALRVLIRVLAVAFFLLIVALLFFSGSDFVTNPLPNLFWIVLLLVGTYVSLAIGGVWEIVNPFSASARMFSPEPESPRSAKWLPYAPPFFLLLLLWLELYSNGFGAIPLVIGVLVIVYSIIGNLASARYGITNWFTQGDFFNMWFGLAGRIAPLQIENGSISLHWPGERLVKESAPHIAVLFFTLLLLSATILDGLGETQVWRALFTVIPFELHNVVGVVLLLVLPAILFVLYSDAMLGTKRLTGSHESVAQLRMRFAYSLVPIAFAYHFAHYFNLILSLGPLFLAQLSDPFARGWNLFGTAGMSGVLIGADTTWYIQLSVIVLGHILAAVVGHRIAVHTFDTRKSVMLSQLPLLFLMVFYTVFGLWTLSQPFVN